jgi:hypothetical protein
MSSVKDWQMNSFIFWARHIAHLSTLGRYLARPRNLKKKKGKECSGN